jgi:uncharacterized protein
MAVSLPLAGDIEALHRKYAPAESVFELVWTHSRIVRDIALQLAHDSQAAVDIELVRAGCLLHDIGVYPLYDGRGFEANLKEYITHGVRGEEILKREGFSEVLCRFASHHTGAGITKAQIIANNLPLPHQDFLAETSEEELVMYADKFHSKTNPPHFNSYDFYANYVTRFGEEAVKSFAALETKFGKPDLVPLIAAYGYALRDMELNLGETN